MKITSANDISPLYDKDGVTGRRMRTQPNVEIIHMKLEPGALLAPHTTPFDVDFFTHQGTAVYLVEDQEIVAEAGTILGCPGQTPHGIRNDTDSAIIVLVIKYMAGKS